MWNLKGLKKFLPLFPWEARKTVVQAMIFSRLGYVNALYLGLTAYLGLQLQVVKNVAAWLLFILQKGTHTSPFLTHLPWVPVNKRIIFKALTLAQSALNNIGPSYLNERIT